MPVGLARLDPPYIYLESAAERDDHISRECAGITET
jgi:hypothetical protein